MLFFVLCFCLLIFIFVVLFAVIIVVVPLQAVVIGSPLLAAERVLVLINSLTNSSKTFLVLATNNPLLERTSVSFSNGSKASELPKFKPALYKRSL